MRDLGLCELFNFLPRVSVSVRGLLWIFIWVFPICCICMILDSLNGTVNLIKINTQYCVNLQQYKSLCSQSIGYKNGRAHSSEGLYLVQLSNLGSQHWVFSPAKWGGWYTYPIPGLNSESLRCNSIDQNLFLESRLKFIPLSKNWLSNQSFGDII